MNYSIELLPNRRWGIYAEQKLLATIGCYQTGREILTRLKLSQKVRPSSQLASGLTTAAGSPRQAA